MTNWHDSPLMIVQSADPTKHDGASLKKILAETEALLANGGYALKSNWVQRSDLCISDQWIRTQTIQKKRIAVTTSSGT